VPHDDNALTGYWHFEELVKERGKGKVRIEFVGGPEAIGTFDQGKAVASGVVDMAVQPAGYYAFLVKIAQACVYIEIPPAEQRERGTFDLILESHKEGNLYLLGWMDHGNQFWLWTNVKVETPYDLSGLRFRSSPFYTPFFNALGLDSIVMSIYDTYAALERGLVVGYAYPPQGLIQTGLTEVTKYRIDHPFWMSALGLIMNLDKWNSLPKDTQDLLIDCAIEHERWVPEGYGGFLDGLWRDIFATGIEHITFSPADAEWFERTSRESGWASYAEEHPDLALKAKELFTK